jgi:TonB-dependent starch-binding outer membrane protein SusC
VGKLRNQGFEVALNTTLMDRTCFGWNLGLNVSTLNSKVLDLGELEELSLGNLGWAKEGLPIAVIIADRITNPDEIAAPIIEEDYINGPNPPTRTIGLKTSFQLPYGAELSARGEYMGGFFLNDNGSGQSLSRAVEWPTCHDAYELIKAGQQDQLTAWQRGVCQAASFRVDYLTYPATSPSCAT